ncbi:MAG: UDP-3-O-(3-hydroxymyristoyl)glucosamine N-acyltransferase [Thermodesulfobacteriota bacterium]
MAIVKSLEELASIVGGTVQGDGTVPIRGVAAFEEAREGELTFLTDGRYLKRLGETEASAVIVKPGTAAPDGVNLLVADNPLLAFARLLDLVRPAVLPAPGIHPGSEVHPGATVSEGASIGAFAVIEEGASIGPGTVIYPNVYVGKGASIGIDAILYPGAAVREGCVLGDRVVVHCNSVIGSDGFGYARVGHRQHKIPQRGIVRIGDDVEIGACVTIDRATLGETTVGRGTKIDNLVQIAHNVKLGEDCVIVAQTGIAGSSTAGDRVQLGGQVGVVGHIEIGSDAMVGAKSGVVKGLPSGTAVSGIPAIPHGDWLRSQSVFPKLPEMKRKISELEGRLRALEQAREKEGGR